MLNVFRSAVVSSLKVNRDIAVRPLAWRHTGYRHRWKSTHASDGSDELTINVPKATSDLTCETGKAKPGIDRSKVPVVNEEDLDEFFVSGHGPGGQNVNKAINCCQIRHRPSGIIVKVHHTRSLEKNRQIARELIATKLDNLYNGEASVENQKKRLALKHMATRESQSERRRTLKEQYKRKLAGSEAGPSERP